MDAIIDTLVKLWGDTGIANMCYQNGIMILISFILLYLAIKKGFEPLLLVPIAFGMLLSNLPLSGMFIEHFEVTSSSQLDDAGLLTIFYMIRPILPCLIFMGIGAMTDFGPMIANPKSLFMGASAQLGIFLAFFLAIILGFDAQEAASIGNIGGANGPTAIYLTDKLAEHLLGPIAVAAYSYMALVPLIQPPIMRLLTTEEERKIRMDQTRVVTQREKILFPIAVTAVCCLLLPSATPLLGFLMLGNLFKECGKTGRLSETASNALMNTLVIILGTSVGATATGQTFLTLDTLKIILLGVIAFGFGTAGGVLSAKLMNLVFKEKTNPLIGSAGVSAVPMAARVSQIEGRRADSSNHLLMHAMGPNVAGVIGSGVAAAVLLSMFGGY